MMLDTDFLARIAPYIEPLTAEERAEYIAEGEVSVKIREREGISPKDYLQLVENICLYLGKTTGEGFESNYQKIPLENGKTLLVIQLPGGGNLNVFLTPEGKMIHECSQDIVHSIRAECVSDPRGKNDSRYRLRLLL